MRVVVLTASPRVAPGLLSREAWRELEEARAVLTGDPAHPQLAALVAAGIAVEVVDVVATTGGALASLLRQRAGEGSAVWLSSGGDAGLVQALAATPGASSLGASSLGASSLEASSLAASSLAASSLAASPPEVLPGSWDLPGAALLDAVATMDRLRSPGGCPWDAEQTHASLTPYLLEEAYEAAAAIEDGDLDPGLKEELGDLLLQVLFHARIAETFDIDDVAEVLVAKLIHRHPHVFADTQVSGAAEVALNWDALKAREKGRRGALDGIPLAQPSLSLAAALLSRAARAGLAFDLPPGPPQPDPGADLGIRLLGLAAEAYHHGVDPERALHGVLRRSIASLQEVERNAARS
ncbi:MAG: MazG family protein [Mycobacteriales bacterium]